VILSYYIQRGGAKIFSLSDGLNLKYVFTVNYYASNQGKIGGIHYPAKIKPVSEVVFYMQMFWITQGKA